MLYDQHRSAPVQIPRDDLTAEDLQQFCKAAAIEFVAMGCPEGCGGTGWEDPTVFRAGTSDWPQAGVTVKLDKVLEWKNAQQAIGERIFEGGVYYHYKGGRYTTVCEATEEASLKSVVVYRGEDGRTWTRPTEEFFSVVKHGDNLVPRFAQYIAPPPEDLTPIPAEAELMTAAQYAQAWEERKLLPTEGRGFWATATGISHLNALAARPDWATHVAWCTLRRTD